MSTSRSSCWAPTSTGCGTTCSSRPARNGSCPTSATSSPTRRCTRSRAWAAARTSPTRSGGAGEGHADDARRAGAPGHRLERDRRRDVRAARLEPEPRAPADARRAGHPGHRASAGARPRRHRRPARPRPHRPHRRRVRSGHPHGRRALDRRRRGLVRDPQGLLLPVPTAGVPDGRDDARAERERRRRAACTCTRSATTRPSSTSGRTVDDDELATEDNVDAPIRPYHFYLHPESDWNQTLAIRHGPAGTRVAVTDVLCKDLSAWPAVPDDKVAVDVRTGRLRIGSNVAACRPGHRRRGVRVQRPDGRRPIPARRCDRRGAPRRAGAGGLAVRHRLELRVRSPTPWRTGRPCRRPTCAS